MDYDSMSLGELVSHLVYGDRKYQNKIIAAIDCGWPRAQETPTSKCAPCPGDASEDVCKRTHGPCDATPRSAPTLTISDDERTVEAIAEAVQRWHDTAPTLNPGRFVMQALRSLSRDAGREG